MNPAHGKRRFKAALFDLDGTLIDTEPLHLDAESQAIERLGANPSDPRRPRVFGMGDEQGLRFVADALGLEFEVLLATYRPLWQENLLQGIQFMPGAEQLLKTLRAREVPMALVTSGDRAYVDLVRSTLSLDRFFHVTVTCDDVAQTKPDAEPYLGASAQLGIRPEECVGFEDSGAGISSLNAAGVLSLAVHREQEQRPELAAAHMRFNDLEEVLRTQVDRLFGEKA